MKYFFLLLLIACGKDGDYVYNTHPFVSKLSTETHQLVGDGGQVDIIWVIDNSGSMDTIQQQVITNTDLFMQEFVKNKSLEWRMGLLSTALYEEPYLGFSSYFTQTDADPVATFGAAVRDLGTWGDATERSFDPVVKQLDAFKSFLRPNAMLIVIFVTDEEEQSQITAKEFLADLVARKSGGIERIRAYGAFNARDFGCSSGTLMTYAASPFEEVITATKGKAYKTCNPTFGVDLAKLGQEIVSISSRASIILKSRPLTETLKVIYNGEELKPGPRSEGGRWFYDSESNSVRFHDLEFVNFNIKDVQVSYEVDEGQ